MNEICRCRIYSVRCSSTKWSLSRTKLPRIGNSPPQIQVSCLQWALVSRFRSHPHSTLLSPFFPSPFFWKMKPAVLLFTLTLFATTVLSLKFPVRKSSRHSLSRRAGSTSISSTYDPHILASSTDALPADAFIRCVSTLCSSKAVPSEHVLSTVNDMIYIVNVRSLFITYS